MFETLENESSSTPKYALSWIVVANKDKDGNPYNVSASLSGDINISSTKTPYIPIDLYSNIGEKKFGVGNNRNPYYYRCCTPVVTENDKYDGFVSYSMCQATGYKLKSNKELPCAYQVFSKLIPMTKNEVSGSGDNLTFKDTVNGEQLYPMYSVLEFEHDGGGSINAINVRMCRVTGIFKADGKDSFTQTSYGNGELKINYLVEVNENNVNDINSALNKDIGESKYMYGAWVPKDYIYTKPDSDGDEDNNEVIDFNDYKYLYIQY